MLVRLITVELCALDLTCSLYYKHIMFLNYASRVVRMMIVSDATTSSITYDCNWRHLVQASLDHQIYFLVLATAAVTVLAKYLGLEANKKSLITLTAEISVDSMTTTTHWKKLKTQVSEWIDFYQITSVNLAYLVSLFSQLVS
jgi:hypothetical protein